MPGGFARAAASEDVSVWTVRAFPIRWGNRLINFDAPDTAPKACNVVALP
jgi:hypothetical protein